MRAKSAMSKFRFQQISGVILQIILFGAMLFIPAGKMWWPRAWIFMGALTIAVLITIFGVFADKPELMNERWKPPVQEGQPLMDKILTVILVVSFFALMVLGPLDVFHFHLLGGPPLAVSILGLAMFFAGWTIMIMSFSANAFAAPVVKHQEERHQVVIDSGVYRFVRHPMYSGALILMPGLPLWLGSYAAAIFAIVPITILALRIVFEERFLTSALQGYETYTHKVRFRLIPGVW
jgi:protein-S-isoprenylcysteine O-methyltransferase Ste14